MAIKSPKSWSDEEVATVRRAIVEHRLNRTDLYLVQAVDEEGRSAQDLSREFLLTPAEIEARVEAARDRVSSALERPSQEAYLGRWVST